MPFIPTNDQGSIHFENYGAGELTHVFLHGWGGKHEFWQDFLENHYPLKSGRAITISFRGHGGSLAGSDGHSYERYANDVRTVMDALSGRPCHLVGFSFGGKVATWIATKYSERINNLTLVAPVGPGEMPFDRQAIEILCNQAKETKLIREFFRPWFRPPVNEAAFGSVVETVSNTPAEVLRITATMLAWTSIAEDIRGLNVPTKIIAGAFDPVYGPDYQQSSVVPHFKSPEMVALPCAHFVPVECPVELAAHVFCER